MNSDSVIPVVSRRVEIHRRGGEFMVYRGVRAVDYPSRNRPGTLILTLADSSTRTYNWDNVVYLAETYQPVDQA